MELKIEKREYLFDKTNIIMDKLRKRYKHILLQNYKNDPGLLWIRFEQWNVNSKLIFVVGYTDKLSSWINNVQFNTSVANYGVLSSNNLDIEFEELCIIINNLMSDFLFDS